MFRSVQADRWPRCGLGRSVLSALLITAAVLSAGPSAAHGQCQYEVAAIIEGPSGCPIGNPNGVVIPQDMNDNGEVVGYWRCPASTTNFAFRWSADAGFELLDIPIANIAQSKALGINDHGDICGTYVVSGDEFGTIGFVLTAKGDFITIPVPDGGTHLEAHAINDSGQVCGWWGDLVKGDPTTGAAFLWQDGVATTILPIDKYHSSRAFALGNAGQVAGWVRFDHPDSKRPFVWHDDVLEILRPIPEGITAEAGAINNSMQVAGDGDLGGGICHAYTATAESAEDLEGVDDYVESWARDIHNNGLIVGYSKLEDAINPATLWHNAEAHNMNLLIDESFPYTLNLAIGINEAGAIIAKTGSLGVLLTPIDQPEADISGDCSVDVVDLLKLLENWSATDSFADIDNNGVVGVSDLLTLLADWNG